MTAAHEDPPPVGPAGQLSVEHSWQLLGTEQLGRLVLSASGRVDIFPVNYIALDQKIYFKTAEGTKLIELTVDHHVVFEVDQVGPSSAWSVVIHGRARRLVHQPEIDAAEALGLKSWLPTIKHNYVEIVADEISGRFLAFGPEPEPLPGY